ncbi:MAG: signal peptidase II [Candidatus Dormibacteraeota bacterium]|nr:signal peptidase II [Candidatus Dormibacteraeota bacterium]
MDRTPTGRLTLLARAAFAGVAVLVFAADRVSKNLVVALVSPGTEVQVFPHLWITNTHNSGAAFSIAPNATLLLLVASVVVAAGLVWYVLRNQVQPATAALLGMVLGGTAGNGYDRLVQGSVPDFIAVHFWPVFNLADAAISVGVVLLVIGYLLRRRPD